MDIEMRVHTPDDWARDFYDGHQHPFLCNWVQGVARTSREGDRDEPAVGPAGSITLRNGACLVGAGDRSHTPPAARWIPDHLAPASLTGNLCALFASGG